MRVRRRGNRGVGGFTLMELVVAILVLAIGAIAATRAGDQAQQALGGMQSRVLARIVAQNRAEELRLFGTVGALPGTVVMGGQSFEVDVREESTVGGLIQATILVRSQLGPGARLVTYVRRLGAGA